MKQTTQKQVKSTQNDVHGHSLPCHSHIKLALAKATSLVCSDQILIQSLLFTHRFSVIVANMR